MKKFVLLLSLIFCFGCESPETEMQRRIETVTQSNKLELAGEGVEIGTLPDARTVVLYRLKHAQSNSIHYLYIIKGNKIELTEVVPGKFPQNISVIE